MLARRTSSSSLAARINKRMKFFGTTTTTATSSIALLGCFSIAQQHRGGLVAVASAFSPLLSRNNQHHHGGGVVRTTSSFSFSSSSSTTALASNKMDQSFKTWSFDKPCTTMEWSELVDAKLTFDGSSSSNSLETATDADLVLIGVMAPPKDDKDDDKDNDDSDSDDDDDEKDKEQKTPTMTLSGLAKDIDDSLNGVLTQILEEQRKTFKNGATIGSTTVPVRVVVPGISNSKAKRYVLLGLGTTPKPEKDEDDSKKKKKMTIKDPWQAAGLALGKAVASACNAKKVETAKVIFPSGLILNATILQDFATSFFEALYSDNRYRTGSKKKKAAEDLKNVTIIPEAATAVATTTTASSSSDDAPVVVLSNEQANAALDVGRKIATGVCLTKDIVNAPHNVLNSISLADTAKRIAIECKSGRIKCQVFGKSECEKRGMGAYLGVARGSETEPQFIHLTYKPASSSSSSSSVKKVGVIGKGLLFDTGGYNIKTASMEQMKFDCGGSAAVLGAARAIGMLEPEGVEAHFIVAACENMINQKAMVPSDILTASNGKTIEVGNTDAEGRLTLADALVFADKEVGAESIIELSTLTGACMVSLGKEISGIWTDNDDLAQELEHISKMTGDKSWRMPMAKEYNKQLESKIADIKNIGTRYGGAITAALFLQNFVSKKKPFAHIDIAGPVWDDKTCATGYGAKLVVEWVRRQGQEKSEKSSD